jgi:hypothetical protein
MSDITPRQKALAAVPGGVLRVQNRAEDGALSCFLSEIVMRKAHERLNSTRFAGK